MSQQKNRPLSPHLGIYRPQISSVLSILHRICSVISFAGLLLAIGWLVVITYSPYSYEEYLSIFFANNIIKLFVVLWTYPFAFYIATEVRYLFWGFGKGFSIKQVDLSGYAAIIGSVVIWLLFWLSVYF